METRHSSSPSWSTSNEDSYSEREKVFSCSDEVSGEEEGGQYESQNTRKTADLQIYTELAAIRDKLKEQLQALVVEEGRVQHLARDVGEREERLARKEDDLKKEGQELLIREKLLSEREAEVVKRETDVSLREENLRSREERVREMERLACEAHKSLVQCMETEVEQRVEKMMGGRREEVEHTERCLREKNRETQRLRKCSETLRQANNSLKKDLQGMEEKNTKLSAQLSASQCRLANLQRKNEQLAAAQKSQQISLGTQLDDLKIQFTKLQPDKKTKHTPPEDSLCYEILGAVLNWLCRVHLSQPLSAVQLAVVHQESYKILPSLATLLSRLPSLSTVNLQLPVVQFTYWCVSHVMSDNLQKSMLSSTLRRIGEAVYKPRVGVDQAFTGSDVHTRILSCLLIFYTVTQVDCLAQVFEQLQHDLKEGDKPKQAFLLYHGINCILPFMKASYRVLCTQTVNTYLLLSVESSRPAALKPSASHSLPLPLSIALLPQFLCGLSTDRWFSACAALLREASHTDTATLEKMSIILQRLSKIKSNRALFESHQIPALLQELLRRRQPHPDSAFLSLNLQSTLSNIHQPFRHTTHP